FCPSREIIWVFYVRHLDPRCRRPCTRKLPGLAYGLSFDCGICSRCDALIICSAIRSQTIPSTRRGATVATGRPAWFCRLDVLCPVSSRGGQYACPTHRTCSSLHTCRCRGRY